MKLAADILAKIFCGEEATEVFIDLERSMSEIAELECYKALCKIKAILEDDSQDDEACFRRIEEIVKVYEDLGSDCGGRHDF